MLSRRQLLAAAAAPLGRAAALRPSVVRIVLPAWRRRNTPGAEDPDLVMPVLSRFAAGAIDCQRAYAANADPAPARAALETGRYPHSLGVTGAGDTLAPSEATLATRLAAAGYRVASASTAEAGRAFLAGAGPGPWYLACDWTPPATPPGGPHPQALLGIPPNVPDAGEPAARAALSARLGGLAWFDAQLGALLPAVPPEAIVVITALTGEMLGSHTLEGTGQPYEECAGVPLLLRLPAGEGRARKEEEALLSAVDVTPTLLALCGLPAPADLDGRDRSAYLLSGKGEQPDSLYVQGLLGRPGEWRMVLRGWDKLVVDRRLAVTHLYNLAQDPYEQNNLAGDGAYWRKREELMALLRVWTRRAGDRVPYPMR